MDRSYDGRLAVPNVSTWPISASFKDIDAPSIVDPFLCFPSSFLYITRSDSFVVFNSFVTRLGPVRLYPVRALEIARLDASGAHARVRSADARVRLPRGPRA